MSPLTQFQSRIEVETEGKGFTDITRELAHWLRELGAGDGLVTVFIRHTSASLIIQENADPDVLADLSDALDKIAPRNAGYRHSSEGPDDMPGHIKSMLTGTSLSIPVTDGALALGTWQGLFVAEHRDRRHRREIAVHYLGTAEDKAGA